MSCNLDVIWKLFLPLLLHCLPSSSLVRKLRSQIQDTHTHTHTHHNWVTGAVVFINNVKINDVSQCIDLNVAIQLQQILIAIIDYNSNIE